jgi:hypothetical protein
MVLQLFRQKLEKEVGVKLIVVVAVVVIVTLSVVGRV